jgi:hypothetical protein
MVLILVSCQPPSASRHPQAFRTFPAPAPASSTSPHPHPHPHPHESFLPCDRRRPHRHPADHALLTFGLFAAATVLLVYIGIALPAVWSAKPARRKAAAAVLHQVFNACTSGERR